MQGCHAISLSLSVSLSLSFMQPAGLREAVIPPPPLAGARAYKQHSRFDLPGCWWVVPASVSSHISRLDGRTGNRNGVRHRPPRGVVYLYTKK